MKIRIFFKSSHKKIIKTLHREEKYNKDSLIIKHHREKIARIKSRSSSSPVFTNVRAVASIEEQQL